MLEDSMSSGTDFRSWRCTTLLDDQAITKLSPEPGLQVKANAYLSGASSVERMHELAGSSRTICQV